MSLYTQTRGSAAEGHVEGLEWCPGRGDALDPGLLLAQPINDQQRQQQCECQDGLNHHPPHLLSPTPLNPTPGIGRLCDHARPRSDYRRCA